MAITVLTITDADRGQEVATNKTVLKATLKTVPAKYDRDYLALANSEGVARFNMHIATSAVSAESILFSGCIGFDSMVVQDIPDGCSVELELTDPPTLTSLNPNTAVSGDPDFTLSCIGTNFVPGTVIRFGPYQDEPTTFVSETEVTTGVKPSLFAPSVVPVYVHTGILWSAPLDFTFTAPVVE